MKHTKKSGRDPLYSDKLYGNNLWAIKEELGLTNKKLGSMTGICYTTIARMVRGDIDISPERQTRIEEATGYKVEKYNMHQLSSIYIKAKGSLAEKAMWEKVGVTPKQDVQIKTLDNDPVLTKEYYPSWNEAKQRAVMTYLLTICAGTVKIESVHFGRCFYIEFKSNRKDKQSRYVAQCATISDCVAYVVGDIYKDLTSEHQVALSKLLEDK